MFSFLAKSHQFRSLFPNYCRKTDFKQRFRLETLFPRFLVNFSEIWKCSVFSQNLVNSGLYSWIIAEKPISSIDFDWKSYFRGFWWISVRFENVQLLQKTRIQAKISPGNLISEVFGEFQWNFKMFSFSQNLVNLGLYSRIIAEKPISSKDFDWKPYFWGFWWISVKFENVHFFLKISSIYVSIPDLLQKNRL